MAGLYIHIPFCHAKCAYCDFYSVADRRRADAVVDAIIREWHLRADETGGAGAIRTIYIGGGTPSCLSAAQFVRLADALPVGPDIEEFTIEVNPEDVTPDAVAIWHSHGVNRVSMGIQSFDATELRTIRRRHSPRDALHAVDTLRRGGIDNLSCDLIYGLPGQSAESWERSLSTLLGLGLQHFSAYCLSYERGTLLYRQLHEGRIEAASDELISDMYGHLCRAAADAGFEHYEIANFARPGFRSRHNSRYWTATPYLGLGPGAHSCDAKGVRRFNPSDIRTYTDGPLPVYLIDEEDDTDRINDLIITGLRTADGLSLAGIPPAVRTKILRNGAEYLSHKMLRLSPDGLSLTIPEQHWLISDAIIRTIMQ